MVTKYCICRDTDTSGRMIQCEHCDEWFHFKCIDVTNKIAKNIEKYICAECCRTHNLKIIYKSDTNHTIKKKTKTDPAFIQVKQEPPEEKRQPERKAPETTLAPIPIPAPVVEQPPVKRSPIKSPRKAAIGKRKGPKAKSKAPSAVQCANPDCRKAARQDESKYCSDACGYAFNKVRYFKFYAPRWKELEQNHSQGRYDRCREIKSLHDEKEKVLIQLKELKEKEAELQATIKTIKRQAKQMYEERKKEGNNVSSSTKNEDTEEMLTGDSAKTYCFTCGLDFARSIILKHWITCHKKHEDTFNLTAQEKSRFPGVDEDPGIFCEVPDKKSGYCRHLKTACPFHTAWAGEKDEICACPLEIMQELVPNGNYCLELKKDCQSHYHWDIFRAADLTQMRIHTFGRLENIQFKLRSLESQLNDTYGGIVGIMLHKTTDHRVKGTTDKADEDLEEMDITVDT